MAFASHRYLKSFDDSRKHIRYIGFREREDRSESLGLFSEKEDTAGAEKFIETLKSKRLSHPDVPVIHTVLFSMSGDEYNRSGFEPGDYQKMIRKIIKDFEVKKGYHLDWVAAEHRNPDHPHCHVAIKGSYKDRDGVEHRLKITNEDRKFFRDQFQQTKEIIRPYDPPPRELSYQHELKPKFNIGKEFINNLFHKIYRELEQEEFNREREQRKKLRKRRGRSR